MESKKFTFLLIFVIFCGVASTNLPDDICEGIFFAFLPHPDPMQCTLYVLCLFEESTLLNCTHPGLIFYPPAENCLPGGVDYGVDVGKI
jgi:hypothetical protein